MRILMISDFYPPFLGGSFRYVQLLSRSLVSRGHEVIVCSIGNKNLEGVEDDFGVKVIRFSGAIQKVPFLFENKEMKYPPPVPDWLVTKKIKSVIRTEKPDIVHAQGWLLYSVLKLKKELQFPLVVTLHDYGYMCPKIRFFKNNQVCDRPFTRNCVPCAKETLGSAKSAFTYMGINRGKNKLGLVDKFLAVSSFVKDANSKFLGIPEDKIVVVPNFYDFKQVDSEFGESEVLPKDFILFVGSLAPYKGVDLLINAYRRLDTPTNLVLIGAACPGHSYKPDTNVVVIENAPYNQVLEAYSKCKFLIVPSVWPEPFGLVALEGMSFKKPIIVSNVGGLKEIVVNNETGIIVPADDSEKLAEAMRYLLENPAVGNEMGQKGYLRLTRKYSTNSVLPQIEEVYRNCIQKSGNSSNPK